MPAIEKQSGQRWLKTSNGTVYGPADAFTLCLWAADARITPGCYVSDDGSNWQTAEACPEYRMQWRVDLPDGSSYGPLNLLSLWELAQDGSVLPGTKLVNALTGKAATLDESIHPLLMAEWRALLSGAGEAMRGAAARLRVEPSAQERDAVRLLNERVQLLEGKLQASEKELAGNLKLIAETQRFLANKDDLVRALQSEAREAESRILRAEAEKRDLASRHAAEVAALNGRLLQTQESRESEAHAARRLELERRLQEAEAGNAAAQTRMAALTEEISGLRDCVADREKAMAAGEAARLGELELLRQKLSLFEAANDRLRVECARLVGAMAEKEKRLTQLSGIVSELEESEKAASAEYERRLAAERQLAERAAEAEALSKRCEEAGRAAREASERASAAEAGLLTAQQQLREALQRERALQSRVEGEVAALRQETEEIRGGALAERRAGGQREAELSAAVERLRAENADWQAKAEQSRNDLEIARRESAETERRLREELANLRRDLNTLLMLRTAVSKVNEETRSRPGDARINWLDAGPQPKSASRAAAGESGFDALSISDQVAALQDEIRAAVERRGRLRKENEILQRKAVERESEFQAREESLRGRISRLEGEAESSSAMVRKAMEEVETREALLRNARKKAEERERQLLARIREMEKPVGAIPIEGEWEHPSPEDAKGPPPGPPPPPEGQHILSHVEARLQTELRQWESLTQDGQSKNGKEKKWFWRK